MYRRGASDRSAALRDSRERVDRLALVRNLDVRAVEHVAEHARVLVDDLRAREKGRVSAGARGARGGRRGARRTLPSSFCGRTSRVSSQYENRASKKRERWAHVGHGVVEHLVDVGSEGVRVRVRAVVDLLLDLLEALRGEGRGQGRACRVRERREGEGRTIGCVIRR